VGFRGRAWVALHPKNTVNGEYGSDCNVAASSARGADLALAVRLWEESERLAAALG
jgi:hypothetical protein